MPSYREAGNEKKVLELIDLAVENLPAHKMLRNFEKEYKKNSQPFDSKDILFPLEEDIKA